MKGIKSLLKVKRRELSEEEKRLKELLSKLEELKLKEKQVNQKIEEIKRWRARTCIEFGFMNEYSKRLFREIDALRRKTVKLSSEIERQKEKLALKRGEVKAVEKLVERREKEKLKKEELLLERFVNEVLNSRTNA